MAKLILTVVLLIIFSALSNSQRMISVDGHTSKQSYESSWRQFESSYNQYANVLASIGSLEYNGKHIDTARSMSKLIGNTTTTTASRTATIQPKEYKRVLKYMEVPSYVNLNDTYKPNSYVEYGDKLTSGSFGGYDMPFLQKVAAIPALLLILGVASLFFFNIALCFRCCCKCCMCFPHGKETLSSDERVAHVNRHRLVTFVSFYIIVIIVLVVDQLVYVGNNYFTQGFKTVSTNIDKLSILFSGVNVNALNIVDSSTSITTISDSVANNACDYSVTQSISGDISSIESSMNTVIDLLTSMIKRLDDASVLITTDGVMYKDYAMYVVWGLSILSMLIFLITHVCKSSCGLKFAMAWGSFTFLIIIILTSPFMLLTAYFGKLCMNPTLNTVSLVYNTTLFDGIHYFATCNGRNVVAESLSDASTNLLTVVSTIATYQTNNNCYTSELTDIGKEFKSMSNSVKDMRDLIGCSNFQDIWFGLINDGLCTELYSGFYSVWVSQLVTSLFIFILLIVSSFSYQHFNHKKNQIYASGDDAEGDYDPENMNRDEENQYNNNGYDDDDDDDGGNRRNNNNNHSNHDNRHGHRDDDEYEKEI